MSIEIIDFWRARLDEDEQVAQKWHDRHCDGCGRSVAARGLYGLVKCITCEPGDVPLESKRVLREIENDRKLIERFEAAHEWYTVNVSAPAGEITGLYYAIQCRVASYSDHPDYQPQWTPSGETRMTGD